MQAKTWEFQTWNKDRQLQSTVTTYLLLQQVNTNLLGLLFVYYIGHVL